MQSVVIMKQDLLSGSNIKSIVCRSGEIKWMKMTRLILRHMHLPGSNMAAWLSEKP